MSAAVEAPPSNTCRRHNFAAFLRYLSIRIPMSRLRTAFPPVAATPTTHKYHSQSALSIAATST
jgi:hypothetical protein